MISGPYRSTAIENFPGVGPKSGDVSKEQSLRRRILAALLHKMPTTGQRIDVEVDLEAGSLVLSGAVRTFHAKQVIHYSCQQLAPEFRVSDKLVVDEVVSAPCWSPI
ncbi:MAG: hypothetical protein ABUL64_03645 [Singulisphaera sp.]